MVKKLLLLLLFTGFRAVFAQFNDTTHYQAVINSSGSVNKTDAGSAYLLNNAFNFTVKAKRLQLSSTDLWVYGKQNQTLTNNDFSSTLFLDIKNNIPHFYYWGLLTYNTSYSLKINGQLLTGAGVAYNIIDTGHNKKNRVNISDGILLDESDLVVNQNYHTYRNSFRLVFHFEIKKIFTLDGADYFQNSLSRGNDHIINSTTTLGLKLQKWLSLTTALVYNKMSITHSDNLIYTYGLSFNEYF